MKTQYLPHFHEFQLLRKINPVCFYAAETQSQMRAAHAFHGSDAYFKLMEQGGGSFESEVEE
jgi:hypothetical protein